MNLSYLRQDCAHNKNIINQWKLLLCGLAAVCYTGQHPHIWEGSFIAVNLHPKHQIPFEEWCKKLEPFMKASDSFDLVAQNNNNLDRYTLLPKLWQALNRLQAVGHLRLHRRSRQPRGWARQLSPELQAAAAWDEVMAWISEMRIWVAVIFSQTWQRSRHTSTPGARDQLA